MRVPHRTPRRPLTWCAVLVACGAAVLPADAGAQAPGADQRPLVVGTHAAPPFAFKDDNGTWQGIGIELWQEAAEELGLLFTIEERALAADLVDGVADGTLDLAVAALTITADREARLDFTHPFFSTGLAIAVAREAGGSGWYHVFDRLVSPAFLKVLGSLFLLLLATGAVIWLVERRGNADQFEREPGRGIASGFWWAAATMTTVGYGDKAPRSLVGRFLGVVWMFAGIILISFFTAHITASLTVGTLGGPVAGLSDLARSRVGAVSGTATGQFLADYRVGVIGYGSLEQALDVLAAGNIDAVVHDEAILRFAVSRQFADRVRVLEGTFAHEDYGIALQEDSRLREPLNRVLLRLIESDAWDGLVVSYLGSAS